jgi:hypothetical protein
MLEKKYYNNSQLKFNPGNYSLATYWSTPSTALCGGTGYVSIDFYEVGIGYLYQGTGAIHIVTPTLIGNTNFCNGSPNTFTLNFPNGNVNSTISISKPGWLINGLVSPVTITGSEFTVSPPSFSDAANLTVSGNNYCASIEKGLIHSIALPGIPSNLTYSSISPQSCYYDVYTPFVGSAIYYEWADNSDFISANTTSTNHTRFASGIDFEQGTSLQIWVRTRNGCGVSINSFNKTLSFPFKTNCAPSKPATISENHSTENTINETVSDDNFAAYFIPGSDILHLELPSGSNIAEVSCFDFNGNLIARFKVTSLVSDNTIHNSTLLK